VGGASGSPPARDDGMDPARRRGRRGPDRPGHRPFPGARERGRLTRRRVPGPRHPVSAAIHRSRGRAERRGRNPVRDTASGDSSAGARTGTGLARCSGMSLERPTIREWPAEDRPRERFLTKGADALSDAECVALLLGAGVSGQTALDKAQVLLAAFGSLAELADREVQELAWVGRLGIAKAVRLGAAV